MSSSSGSSSSKAPRPSDQELTQTYNTMKSELNQVAQKIGELETEADEHTLVIETLTPLDPDRRCFRLVGGVLVERTVKEVLPALKTNQEGIKTVTMQLVQKYKNKEDEFMAFQKKYNIQPITGDKFQKKSDLRTNQDNILSFRVHKRYLPSTMVVVNVKWVRDKKAFDFGGRSLSDIRLGELRQQCHEWSKVPIEGITLISSGATMKDNTATLSSYGIRPDGTVTMMGTKSSKRAPAAAPPAASATGTSSGSEETALVARIQELLQKTIDLTAEHVPKYERAIEEYIQSNPLPISEQRNDYGERVLTPARKWLRDEHTLLSEKLMQALLVLDDVICKPHFELARGKRKQAVIETQRLLDVVDQMNDRVKACDEAASGRL